VNREGERAGACGGEMGRERKKAAQLRKDFSIFPGQYTFKLVFYAENFGGKICKNS